ncbi:MAG: CRISPR-associated RAMP protein Csx7 [Bryobacteraceae bacterium]|jgi:CRISPR-associated RAMP protein (TIGR02581 family)
MSATTFLSLNNRYLLECSLHAEGSLHVGTGLISDTTDAPFVRSQGRPFLPGSSLRGAIRSHVERIVHALKAGHAHILFEQCDKEICYAGNQPMLDKYQTAVGREYEQLPAPELCAVCRLFGSPLMAARLKIGDAVLSASDHREPVKRDGVGIDRDTGTAKEHIKYDFEVLERGANFTCSWQLENADDSDFALLRMVLGELKLGLEVGGKKSRGLGRVVLAGYKVSFFDPAWGHDLQAYLKSGLKSGDVKAFEERLERAFDEWIRPENNEQRNSD